jgi:hypothetical protein
MCFFFSLIPATVWVIIGFFVLFASTKAASVRYWPKADTRGRILGPKIGYPASFALLSVRFRPKADIRVGPGGSMQPYALCGARA